MATATRKRRRSAKQKANDKRLGAMARARHRGATTKTRAKRKARRSKTRAHAPTKTRRRRRARKHHAVILAPRRAGRRRGRRGGRRAKHRAKHVRRGKSRGRARRARRSRVARVVFLNPRGAIGSFVGGYIHGLTHIKSNMNAALHNGVKGYAAAAGGAVGAVFLGTILARFVMPAALKFAPKIAASPIGARVLSFGLYYSGAFAIARFTPGLKQSTRDAIMFGGLVAAVLEIVKPGIIAKAVGYIPIAGPMLAPKLGGIESELADYVESALNGLGFTANEYDGRDGFHGWSPDSRMSLNGTGRSAPAKLSELANYAMNGWTDSSGKYHDGMVGNYALNSYEEAGLSCPMQDGSPE